MLPSNVSYWLSSSNRASRARASIRKCLSHFGQTFMFSSRSFFQMIWRQPSHFTHNPSVRTFFIGVLHLAHLGYGVGSLDDCWVSVSARQDDMHHFWFLLQAFNHLGRI